MDIPTAYGNGTGLNYRDFCGKNPPEIVNPSIHCPKEGNVTYAIILEVVIRGVRTNESKCFLQVLLTSICVSVVEFFDETKLLNKSVLDDSKVMLIWLQLIFNLYIMYIIILNEKVTI